MSDSRLEKFIYAICSMDVSDLPVPLSRIETLWNCLITGETPDFEPLSRNEKYLMAMLDRYDISNLPAPMSRGEKLLYKIAVDETDLSDVPGYLSRYEELLKYLIENGGISGGDFEYVLYTLNQSLYTLYTTAEKPVKSAILKGSTKYRDIDTGEFLETFEEGRNLELVSVKMPVLKTANSNNLIDTNPNSWHIIDGKTQIIQNKPIEVQPNTTYSFFINMSRWAYIFKCDEFGNMSKQYIGNNQGGGTFVTDDDCYYIIARNDLFADVTRAHTDKMRLFPGTKDLGYTGFVDEVKSNILTVNEEVELRGIDDVRDTLDLISGEIIESIGEDVLNGSEEWLFNAPKEQPNHWCFHNPQKLADEKLLISDRFHQNDIDGDRESIRGGGDFIFVYISKEKVEGNVNSFKQWLSQNPIKYQYRKSEKSVKTVDLTVVDQDNQPTELGTFENVTHVSLEAENLIPEVEMEVATRISTELASASPLMDDISTEQQQLNEMVNEQSENVDATMIATTEIFEEIL